ncbi:MAG: DUF5340 domain-containing protein [Kaiparowitsia implicata GSE-PSE-MK54-09C]|jgi:hypothetical protein|nr:DUF5340 domain-containing protein [Kaiparowitsia implicata GSE-PSE-MK54-09C]
MNPPIPLPSHIHYELLLQLLERQTTFAVASHPQQRELVHELIITLRKALSQQKHLEQSCDRARIPIDYRWALNNSSDPNGSDLNGDAKPSPDAIPEVISDTSSL